RLGPWRRNGTRWLEAPRLRRRHAARDRGAHAGMAQAGSGRPAGTPPPRPNAGVRELATLTSMVTVATILVVDDEPRIVQLVRDYLEHGGFTVLVASDGQAALRTARTGRPDLVVLDLGLPGLDGLDVARALRRGGEVP